MLKGDVSDSKMDTESALEFYLAANKLSPEDPDLLVRIARQYRGLMMDIEDKKKLLELGRISLDYAQKAVALAPNDAQAHLSVAISYGKLLPLVSKQEQVEASPKIKAAVDRALQLDPKNDLAWHVLGRWHRSLADVTGVRRALAGAIFGGLPEGSNDEALKCLDRAIELNPKRSMHYVELGKTYAQMGREEDARQAIQKCLGMPNLEKDDVEAKERGHEMLAQLR